MNTLELFITALGLAFFIESLPWLIAPRKMQQVLHEVLAQKPEHLRLWGVVLLLMALVLVWLGTK